MAIMMFLNEAAPLRRSGMKGMMGGSSLVTVSL